MLKTEILKLCDDVRDNVLPELGVRLEDVEGEDHASIKLDSKENIMREKQEKKQVRFFSWDSSAWMIDEWHDG